MSINSRVKEVRKALGLSQEYFGNQLGVTRGAITNIELEKTEPKSLFIELLCKVFNVNIEWLTTGVGQMFNELTKDEKLAQFVGQVISMDDDAIQKRFVDMLMHLNEEELKVVEKMAQLLVKKES